jgi:GTPase Era involved in 16S rRNA processing
MFVSFWLWWCLALSVCFLVHFQIPLSSANAELQDALEHKKRLIVLNKMDLANPNMMLKWVKHFEACKQHHVFVNAHQQKAVKKMLDMARELLSERLAKEPTLLLMILGIPNVGKSALVNSLFHLSHSSTSGKVFPSRVSLGDVCKHAILVSCYSGLLHDIMTESSPCCLQKCNSRSGHRIMYTYFAEFWTHFCCT